jgi:hypothetical protein
MTDYQGRFRSKVVTFVCWRGSDLVKECLTCLPVLHQQQPVSLMSVSGSVSATALRADLIVGWHCSLSADVTSGCSSDAGDASYVLIEDSK